MRTAMPLAAAVLALPLIAFGCAVDTTVGDDVQEAEMIATAEQAITANQRVGIGKIFDTGVSLGFAEFFAANAKDSITTLRTQYATAVYTTAESWCGNGTCDPNETPARTEVPSSGAPGMACSSHSITRGGW
jgi:hypothetical protein